MEVLKIIVTVLDFLFIFAIWFSSRSASNKAGAISLGAMAMTIFANIVLVWK